MQDVTIKITGEVWEAGGMESVVRLNREDANKIIEALII